jgi:hypothetical protein
MSNEKEVIKKLIDVLNYELQELDYEECDDDWDEQGDEPDTYEEFLIQENVKLRQQVYELSKGILQIKNDYNHTMNTLIEFVESYKCRV